MPSSAAVPSTIDLNDPRLTETITLEDYDPVTLDGDISPRYTSLRDRTKNIVRYLWHLGYIVAAARLAMCSRHGSVYKKCKAGKHARAHRHTCHLWICHYCGLPWNLLRCWMRKRSDAVRTERQVGIEIVGPLGGDIELAGRKMALWFGKRGADSVRRLGVDVQPRNVRLRLVAHISHLPYRECLDHLRLTMGTGWMIQPYRESDPIKVLKWMFASTEGVLMAQCGKLIAAAFLLYKGHHMIKTHGDFYRETKESLVSLPESYTDHATGHDPSDRCNCGHCDGIMINIPPSERIVQTVEKIQDSYQHVDWSSCYDPFRISRKDALTPNSVVDYGIPLALAAAIAASPPI